MQKMYMHGDGSWLIPEYECKIQQHNESHIALPTNCYQSLIIFTKVRLCPRISLKNLTTLIDHQFTVLASNCQETGYGIITGCDA